jgi:Undecaprenyl-phosphate galactose phosphotransferase WbaP
MTNTAGLGSALDEFDAGAASSRGTVARHSFSLWQRWALNALAILISDTVALAVAVTLVGAMRHWMLGGRTLLPSLVTFIPGWWLVASAGHLLPGWGLSTSDHLRRQVMLLTGLFALREVLPVVIPNIVGGSPVSWAAIWAVSICLVPLARMVTRGMLCARGVFGVETVIFGHAKNAADVVQRLRDDPGLGYLPIGICANEDGDTDLSSLPIVGTLDQNVPLAPVAIVVGAGLSRDANEQLVKRVVKTYRKLLILPDLGEIPTLWVAARELDGMVGLEISQTLLSPFATTLKRLVDVVLVLGTAVLWVPLCWLISALIFVEDRHNPVFRQVRTGRGGVPFYAYKFRTMVTDAEAVLQRHLEADPELRSEWETHFKLRRDPRITRVGNFLRRTSLDELPQLINVLFGEMSLVGPRPLPLYHLEKLPHPVRDQRARMRPGMTGLWQVSGRSDAGTDGMARWDPYYVRNWSIWLDIVILVRTVRVVIMGSGAR